MLSSSPQRPPSPGRLFSVDGQHDDTAAASSDEDEDTLRRLMQTFGSKKGGLSYERNGGDCDSCSDTDSSASDDIAYLQRLQEQFVPHSTGYPHTPPIMKPMRSFPSLDTDEEDDFETLRAIQRRFAHYGSEVTPKDFSAETSAFSAGKFGQTAQRNKENPEENHSLSDPFDAPMRTKALHENNPEENHSNINQRDSFSVRPLFSPRFSKSVQNFVDALKKNRACQRFIREKLMEIEAKIEVNRKLKDHIKCFMNFHAAYKRKVGHSLCQKWDPRVRLISFRKQKSVCTIKENSKTCSALYFAPAENLQVSNYEMVMRRFPVTLRNRRWSDKEKDKLLNGVKQQCQEMLLLNSMNLGSDVDALDDSIIMSTFDSADKQVTTENLRLFIPFVNWDRLACMYLPKRSGPSCESRWLNHEDPTINCKPWTLLEDKKLLFTVQDRGIYNWIDIALILGTNRTPFQCLARYQRSLNPHILNREWTTEEDAKLHASVKSYGDKNWQIVASYLDGRTSNQCSVRWRNTLLPERKRVGRWSVNEDKRLKVSVILFGAKNWKNISQFIPGRTQSQCRERWLNCLDPSLNLERWTGEEDAKLLAAIAEHGHSWSKIAAYIPGRTDNQCRRRWKVLLPHEVSMLKVAQQLKKTVLISNFVGRESERPAIGPNDFTPTLSIPGSDIKNYGVGKKRLRKQSNPGINKNGPRNKRAKKYHCKSEKNGEEISRNGSINSLEVAHENVPHVPVLPSSVTKVKRTRKRTLRIQHKGLKSQEREQIDDIIASNNLGEDLFMELPLAQVMKLISRKGNSVTEDRNANSSLVSRLADGF